MITFAVVLPVVLGALITGMLAGISIQRMITSVRQMRDEMRALSAKIDQVEASHKARNPYRTNDGLEDAMAIIHDATWQAEATLDYVHARMRQVDQTLKIIRSDPDSYDSEQPNQKRSL